MRSALVLSLALALAGGAALAAEAPPDGPAWKAELREKLAKKVTFEFVDTPLDEALGFLQTMTAAPIIQDPAVKAEVAKAKVTLRVTDKALSAALAQMLQSAKLEHRLVNHAVLVTKPGAPDPAFSFVRAAEDDPEAKKAILARLPGHAPRRGSHVYRAGEPGRHDFQPGRRGRESPADLAEHGERPPARGA